jgi:hypothetical protein
MYVNIEGKTFSDYSIKIKLYIYIYIYIKGKNKKAM